MSFLIITISYTSMHSSWQRSPASQSVSVPAPSRNFCIITRSATLKLPSAFTSPMTFSVVFSAAGSRMNFCPSPPQYSRGSSSRLRTVSTLRTSPRRLMITMSSVNCEAAADTTPVAVSPRASEMTNTMGVGVSVSKRTSTSAICASQPWGQCPISLNP